MKKHIWLDYGNTREKVEIIIRDFSDAKIERFKANTQEGYEQILKHLEKAYNYKLPRKKGDEEDEGNVLSEGDFNWD